MCAETVAPLPNNPSSLPYTAPEVLQSVLPGAGGTPCAAATAEADVWALGVVAFELLTSERVFREGTPLRVVRAALAGKAPLPWEEGAEGAEGRLQRLRGLRRLVLPCLERNPAKRPCASAVMTSWWHLFDECKTRGTFDSNTAQPPETTRADPTASTGADPTASTGADPTASTGAEQTA